MKLAGIQKNSFNDYPGKIAAVLFTPGCNLDCFYCHNRQLLQPSAQNNALHMEGILGFLQKRKAFLDGVVITGGEPTLQQDLEECIQRIRDIGYPVKLDTNGTRPQILQKLLQEKLLAYIAMDIKAPLSRYEEICRTQVHLSDIQESIQLIQESGIEYEFRTTCIPQLNRKDIQEIVSLIPGAKRYALQQYRRPQVDIGPEWFKAQPHPAAFFTDVAEQLQGMVQHVELRGVDG